MDEREPQHHRHGLHGPDNVREAMQQPTRFHSSYGGPQVILGDRDGEDLIR